LCTARVEEEYLNGCGRKKKLLITATRRKNTVLIKPSRHRRYEYDVNPLKMMSIHPRLQRKRCNKDVVGSCLVVGLTLRNLYSRNVNQLVSIFSATDSVLTHKSRKTTMRGERWKRIAERQGYENTHASRPRGSFCRVEKQLMVSRRMSLKVGNV